MSQLYDVTFTAHYPHHVDTGRVLVCAPSIEAAADIVVSVLELPRSSTQCTVNRIKPALFTVERRTLSKDHPKIDKRPPAPLPQFKFAVMIEAAFEGNSEEHVLRKTIDALREKLAGGQRETHHDLRVDVVPLKQGAQKLMKAMEKVEAYRPKTFYGGIRRSPKD